MYAVIRTGGKQYKVAEDEIIYVEKLAGEKGESVQFNDVLMVGGTDSPKIGTPLVDGASVAGEVIEQTRGDKIIVFKKNRRQGYRRKKGHRQLLTCVRITGIGTDGKAPAKKAAAKKPAAKKEEAPAADEAKAAPAPKAKAAEAGTDDISKISGVGPVLVKKLSDLGYTSLQQIADMTPEQVTEVDEALSFKGRIDREEWIEQAKELIAGKPPRAKVDQ
ncbi:MAG: 50S ribosomal protein L21 [Alphaproteobacteria bacterium]|nr:50S ribosomal protein L21 [Alphaproteobacteria bacterium]